MLTCPHCNSKSLTIEHSVETTESTRERTNIKWRKCKSCLRKFKTIELLADEYSKLQKSKQLLYLIEIDMKEFFEILCRRIKNCAN